MNQFKMGSTVKTVQSSKALSVMNQSNSVIKQKGKRNTAKGGRVSKSKIHRVYNNKILGVDKISTQKPAKVIKAAAEVESAKNIFITETSEKSQKSVKDPQNIQITKANESKQENSETGKTREPEIKLNQEPAPPAIS